MARRKNTAETFEILHQLSVERRTRERLKKDAAKAAASAAGQPQPPGSPEGVSPGKAAPEAAPTFTPQVQRSPLLGPEASEAPRRISGPAAGPRTVKETLSRKQRAGARAAAPALVRFAPEEPEVAAPLFQHEPQPTILERFPSLQDRSGALLRGQEARAAAAFAGSRATQVSATTATSLFQEETTKTRAAAGPPPATASSHEVPELSDGPPLGEADRVVKEWAEAGRGSVDPVLLGAPAQDLWEPVTRRIPEGHPSGLPLGGASRQLDSAQGPAALLPQDLPPRDPDAADPRVRSADQGPLLLSPVEEDPRALTADPVVPSRRAWARGALGLVQRGGSWLVGDGSNRWLERRVELKISTLLVLGMGGIVVVTLILTSLRLPGLEDPLFRANREGGSTPLSSGVTSSGVTPSPGSGSRSAPGSALAPTPPSPERLLTEGAPGPAAGGALAGNVAPPQAASPRKVLPLWGPGSQVEDAGGGISRAPDPAPEVRNVMDAVPRPPAAQADPGGQPETREAPAVTAGENNQDGLHYKIQVRALESMEGAQRIFDYLALLGFETTSMKEDRRRSRPDGEKVYTVFVGRYADRGDADRECERLKRESRARPYKGKPDFFANCLVVTFSS